MFSVPTQDATSYSSRPCSF